MTEKSHFELEFPALRNAAVRLDEFTKTASVLDVIGLVTGSRNSARTAWFTLQKEAVNAHQTSTSLYNIVYVTLPGMSKPTPMATNLVIKLILGRVLPGCRIPIQKKAFWLDVVGCDSSCLMQTYVETETVSVIRQCTACTKSITQYYIKPYRVDLYYPDLNLVVECDEHGHLDRDLVYEQERQNFITLQLNCKWLRYNPHHPIFSVYAVVSDIVQMCIN